MEFKTMYINQRPQARRAAGFTLAEVMVASAVASLLFMGLASFSLYTSRACTAMANYSEIESQSRQALDRLCRQIRQSKGLTEYAPDRVTVKDSDDQPLTFAYDAASKTLSRTKGGQSQVLLAGCDYLRFDIFQRTPKSNSFEAFPATTPAACKMVQVTWMASRDILGSKQNSDVVQSAKIVIRKKPD
jgi:prepilin-type N-terminal cleavage/methylation domain-containing protein